MASTKKCSCKSHDNFTSESTIGNIIKIKGKKIRKAVIDVLIDRGYLFIHSTYLCQGCARFTETNFLDHTQMPRKRNKIDLSEEAVQAVISILERGECSIQ